MFGKGMSGLLFRIIITVSISLLFVGLCLQKLKPALVISFVLFLVPPSFMVSRILFKKFIKKLDVKGFILIFFFFYPLLPSMWGIKIHESLPVLRAHRVATLILILYLLKNNLFIKSYTDFFKEKIFNYSILFLFSALFLSSFFSPKVGTSIFFTLSMILEFFILSVVIFSFFKNMEDINRLVNILFFSAMFLAFIALYEKVTRHNPYSIFGAFASELERGLSHQMRGGEIRINGPFFHSISFGAYFSLSLPFIFYKFKDKPFKLVSSLGIVVLAILATQSRSAQIGMFIIVAFYFLFYDRKNLLIILFFLTPIVIFKIDLLTGFLEKLNPFDSSDAALAASSGARREQFLFLIKYIRQNLIIGVGNIDAPALMRGTPSGSEGNYQTSIDNLYLLFTYHWGLMGLSTWLYLMLDSIKKPIQVFKKEIVHHKLLVLIIVGIFAFSVINMVVALYSFHFIFWIYIGILARLIVIKRDERIPMNENSKLPDAQRQ